MRIAVPPAVALLAGCGNASEHLVMGQWQEVGQAESPIAGEQSSFVVTTLVPGDGPLVRPADLVKVRLTVTTVDTRGSTRSNPPPQIIWVWTGRAPQPETGTDLGIYGMLGGAQPRATLIGHRLHEQFQIDLREGVSPTIGTLPVRGLIDSPFSRLRKNGLLHGHWVEPIEWPDVALSGITGGRPSGQIEILEICPGAKF